MTKLQKEPTTFQNYIDNRWVPGSAGGLLDDENPAKKGAVLARFQASSPEDVTRAVDAAAKAFQLWKSVPVTERQLLARRFLQGMQNSKETLAAIVSKENGKTLKEARTEVESALTEGDHHVNQVSAFTGATLPTGTNGMTGWVQYAPLGVAGIISPWNFPVNVMCRKALPALLTGNTVVFKPASFTPWAAVHMAALFSQAGFPEGVFNCVTGPGSALGNALIEDPRVRAISFTGSTEVGKMIQQKAAQMLTRTQLELGGKNALIVMDDADLDAAADAAAVAGFACAGQWCTSTSRVLVQKRVLADFTDKLARRCEGIRLGDPLDAETEMGPVAGPDQFESISRAIECAVDEGARLVTGGIDKERVAMGYFIRPTLFGEVAPAMSLFREEVFGPVLGVTEFESLQEALTLANDSPYALSSAIFTSDLSASLRYIDEIEAGLAHVNMNTGYKHPALPFGGWKESGFGPPENSRSGLKFFVQEKAVYIGKG